MNSELQKAARLGNVEYLKQLGGEEADAEFTALVLNSTTPQGNTALHIVSKLGHHEFAAEILNHCTALLRSTNLKGDTPLHVAAMHGQTQVVETLIKFCRNGDPFRETEDLEADSLEDAEIWRMANRDNDTALHVAIRGGHCEVVKMLLREDGDLALMVNNAGESPLYLAAEVGSVKIVHQIITTAAEIVDTCPDGRTALHAAVIMGHLEVVKELLRERPHLIKQEDSFQSTALHYASSTGKLEIAQLLLHTDLSLAYMVDENKLSPLHIAAGSGHKHIIRELLMLCPDVAELLNQNGQNVLHVAVENEDIGAVAELLRSPDVVELINEVDNDRNTPMHLATSIVNYPIVKLLLATQNVNLRAKNSEGQTALDCIELNKSNRTYQQVLIWQALNAAGAVQGQRQHRKNMQPTVMPGGPGATTVDESYKSMANTLSVVAALIATVTFAAVFTMPKANKLSKSGTESSLLFIKEAAFKAFVLADTVAMCTSMIVALVLVWAVPGIPGMLVNAVGWALRLMWIALGGMVVTFVMAVYIVVSPDCLWLAVVVCILGCSVPFLVTPIVTVSARLVPHGKKNIQYDQIQPPLTYKRAKSYHLK